MSSGATVVVDAEHGVVKCEGRRRHSSSLLIMFSEINRNGKNLTVRCYCTTRHENFKFQNQRWCFNSDASPFVKLASQGSSSIKLSIAIPVDQLCSGVQLGNQRQLAIFKFETDEGCVLYHDT